MRSNARCKLCLTPYDPLQRVPLVLSCGHTFCKACLTSRAAATQLSPAVEAVYRYRRISPAAGQVICPVDSLPDGRDISAIPANFQLIEVLQVDSLAPAAAEVRWLSHQTPGGGDSVRASVTCSCLGQPVAAVERHHAGQHMQLQLCSCALDR